MAAVQAASLVIAEVNPNMPVIHGDGYLPASRIDAWVSTERPVLEVAPEPLDEVALEIGRNVATLIEDGSTLQLGIGGIPDATLKALHRKKDLGIWTEMFSDGRHRPHRKRQHHRTPQDRGARQGDLVVHLRLGAAVSLRRPQPQFRVPPERSRQRPRCGSRVNTRWWRSTAPCRST